jgi:hypothetical protein
LASVPMIVLLQNGHIAGRVATSVKFRSRMLWCHAGIPKTVRAD